MNPSHFQFTLKHAFVAVALLSALFAGVAQAGPFGAVIFVALFGIVLTCFAALRKNRPYAFIGGMLTVAATITLLFGATVAVGDGRATLPCTVHVVDADGHPVPDAKVYLRNVTELRDPPGVPDSPMVSDEWFAQGTTNEFGDATIPFEFPVSSRSGLLMIDETFVLIMQTHWLQVDASGYERVFVPLERGFGRKHDWNKPPLPAVTVELSRAQVP